VVDIVRELADFGIAVQLHDPMADGDLLRETYGLSLTPFDALKPADAVVLAVAHHAYRDGGWTLVSGLLGPSDGFRGRHSRPARSGIDADRRDALAPLERFERASMERLVARRRPALGLPKRSQEGSGQASI